jgi:hypothetical protein
MNNPEKLATYGTEDEEKQNKNTAQYVDMAIFVVSLKLLFTFVIEGQYYKIFVKYFQILCI